MSKNQPRIGVRSWLQTTKKKRKKPISRSQQIQNILDELRVIHKEFIKIEVKRKIACPKCKKTSVFKVKKNKKIIILSCPTPNCNEQRIIRKEHTTTCRICGIESVFKVEKLKNAIFLVCPEVCCDGKINIDNTYADLLRRELQQLRRKKREQEIDAYKKSQSEPEE